MFKKRIWLGIILSAILLVFSISGFTAYYKYTQESGTNFYVGDGDKADALEDTNEVRQILDDLGNLLGHSLRNDLYPKDGDNGGYLGRLNYGVDVSKPSVPVVNDVYLATDTVKVYRCFVAGNWVQVYPEADGATTFLGLTDTPASYTGKAGEILRVNPASSAVEFSGIIIDPILSDDENDVPTSHAVYYFCETTKDYVKKTDTVNVLSDITSTGANIEDAVTKKHTQNTDTQFDFYNALASDNTYSGEVDSQPVGEMVGFGNLLYFNWTDKEWKLADADATATMPGLRIALETKTDGQTCLMLVKGYIRDDDNFQFGGSMVYASTVFGAVSHIAPTETGDQIQRVGVAKSADILFFDPSIDVGEI